MAISRTLHKLGAAGRPVCARAMNASRAAGGCVTRERGDEFEGCAAGEGGQIVFADAMSEFNDEVVIRREDSHRLYEFLFFIHFHVNDYGEGGWTKAVQP